MPEQHTASLCDHKCSDSLIVSSTTYCFTHIHFQLINSSKESTFSIYLVFIPFFPSLLCMPCLNPLLSLATTTEISLYASSLTLLHLITLLPECALFFVCLFILNFTFFKNHINNSRSLVLKKLEYTTRKKEEKITNNSTTQR